MAVFDASVLVEYLARGEHAALARERLLAERWSLRAPHLVDAEVGHVLRRRVARGQLDEAAARRALDERAALPLLRSAHPWLLARAWGLRQDITFSDGLYVALAERVDEALVTFDRRIAGAPGLRAEVEVLGEG